MPRDTKSKPSQNVPTPTQALAKLTGYMEAAGYAADHPWRLEIASTLNSPATNAAGDAAETDSAMDHARDAYNVACVARSLMRDNIAPVMNAIATLSDFDSMDVGENRHRLGLIKRLAKLGSELVCDAATRMESDEYDMQAKMSLLEGGAA